MNLKETFFFFFRYLARSPCKCVCVCARTRALACVMALGVFYWKGSQPFTEAVYDFTVWVFSPLLLCATAGKAGWQWGGLVWTMREGKLPFSLFYCWPPGLCASAAAPWLWSSLGRPGTPSAYLQQAENSMSLMFIKHLHGADNSTHWIVSTPHCSS